MVARQRSHFTGQRATVAGVDESGRGPLAGPVVAAAVILDEARPIDGLRDSKLLTARRRLELARDVRRYARAFALAAVDPGEIDEVNILEASLLAMERAVMRLGCMPDLLQVDGTHIPRFTGREILFRSESIVRGDQRVPAISAASILAKVCRDRLMQRWHRSYPRYGFDQHKGYPTRAHLRALDSFGPCPIHRLSFEPVRRVRREGRA